MDNKDLGRVASQPGSREPSPTVSALTGFDPSRGHLENILSAQHVQPYRGWNITSLNKHADAARAFLGYPSIRELNPDIAAMQDHVAANRGALLSLQIQGEPLAHPMARKAFAALARLRHNFPAGFHGLDADAALRFADEVIDAITGMGASGIEARSDETRNAAQPEGREPGGDSRDAQGKPA